MDAKQAHRGFGVKAMILKASQWAGASALSKHLMNEGDNDHVTLLELQGFVSCNLDGALAEVHAISRATQCKQFMFSLSINPPKDQFVTDEEFLKVADQVGVTLGLSGQPRAVVAHEKEGRRHAHVVWSRIDMETMTAIDLPFFKYKLTDLSRELHLQNGWHLPVGLQTHCSKSPLNFTLAEWQQAKRQNVDPREIKQVLQEAWKHSDNALSFKNALEERGYFLAKGDRRGFVALDVQGNIYSLSRWAGVKNRELEDKLGFPDKLPSVDETKSELKSKISDQVKEFISEVKDAQKQDLSLLLEERSELKITLNYERQRLQDKQNERWIAETKMRSDRLNKGMRGLFDWVSGKAKETKSQNEIEAYQALQRDQKQRDALIKAQMRERQELQKRIDAVRNKHQQDRKIMARNVAQSLGRKPVIAQEYTQSRTPRRTLNLTI